MFTCNVCGASSSVPLAEVERETPSCPRCRSTLRFRGMVAALSRALYGEQRALADFASDPGVRGIGCSDWEGYAKPLASHFEYHNTFYHREPRLDLCAPVSANWAGSCDFILCSDVLEHVPPPAEVAMATCLELLKPGGVLVLSVPYTLDGGTLEHYPRLDRYEIQDFDGTQILVNRRADGGLEVFEDLVFHGGDGATLEMRVFSREGLIESLRSAGFAQVEVFDETVAEFGIAWHQPWSLPVIARAPG